MRGAMIVTYIDEKDAPPITKPGPSNRRANELAEILNGIPKGSVARIYLDGETPQSLRCAIGAASRWRGINVEYWTAEGGESVYVKRD
jgi:hypothetical protein